MTRSLTILLALMLASSQAAAQTPAMPDYHSLNPLIVTRSGLRVFPYVPAGPDTRLALSVEYGSAAELDVRTSARYVLDAEIYRVTLTATRDLTRRLFVMLHAGVSGTHAGVADAFFDEFHRAIGYRQWAREQLPHDVFAYAVQLPGSDPLTFAPRRLSLTDVQLALARRHSAALQTVLTLTLPAGPAGYGHGTTSLNLSNTLWLPLHADGALQATAGVGYTPARGPLAPVQRTLLGAASTSLRARVWRRHSLFGTLFYHTPLHDDVDLPEFTNGELAIEFGFITATRAGAEWRLGLVENLRAVDSGIDLDVKLSVSW